MIGEADRKAEEEAIARKKEARDKMHNLMQKVDNEMDKNNLIA